jgi:pyridoxal 5'-phosphate synthase pdxT subunit
VIGILDLQGDVVEHLDHLERLGIPTRRVKEPAELDELSGLIIPGGESTCLSRLMKIFGFHEAVIGAHNRGLKIWGTCAGAILLATEVIGESPHLGLIDMTLERNSFGSQLDSFFYEAAIPQISPDLLPLVFIRAPKIKTVGKDVTILLQMGDYIAAAETENVLITVFHPELTGSLAFHRYFAVKCGLVVDQEAGVQHASWTATSWTRYARIAG